MGGLPKKAHILSSLRQDDPVLLALDSGALLFRPGTLPAGQLEQLQASARGIVAAYNSMSFQAVAVAAADLGAGLDFLLDMQKHSRFPWLSANIVTGSSNRHIFTPYTVLAAGDLRIGVIGLTGPEAAELLSGKDNALLLPWSEALPPQLALATELSDMLVLLSSLPPAENKQIAERFPEIHIILQSGTGNNNMAPHLVNNSLITWVENQGRHAGLLDVQWNLQEKRWQDPAEQELLLGRKNEMDGILWQLGRFRSQGDPETVYRDQPHRLRTYHALIDRQKALQKEISRLESDLSRQAVDSRKATFSHRFYAMDRKVPDHPEVRAIVEATTREVNSIGGRVASGIGGSQPVLPALPLPAGYAGNRSCRQCHESQWNTWRASRHARAYDTLAAKNQEHNMRCLPCHVTGGFVRTGPEIINHAEELRAVGCESCHGPAAGHTITPAQNKPPRLATGLCFGCHTPDQSPDFNITEALARLGCGG